MTTLTDAQLDELERLERDATSAPWVWATSNSWRRLMREGGRDGDVLCPVNHPRDHHEDLSVTDDNMAIIAAARNALPALIAEVRAARAAAGNVVTEKRSSLQILEDAVERATGESADTLRRRPIAETQRIADARRATEGKR